MWYLVFGVAFRGVGYLAFGLFEGLWYLVGGPCPPHRLIFSRSPASFSIGFLTRFLFKKQLIGRPEADSSFSDQYKNAKRFHGKVSAEMLSTEMLPWTGLCSHYRP